MNCSDLGYKVGDEFVVKSGMSGFTKEGEILVLDYDDNSDIPQFRNKSGRTFFYSLSLVEKVKQSNERSDFGLVRGDKIKIVSQTHNGRFDAKFRCGEVLTIHKTDGDGIPWVINEDGDEHFCDLTCREWKQINEIPSVKLRLTPSQHKVEFIGSLASAIQEAGGSVEDFVRHDITLDELANALAQNGVRFVFDKSLVK